MTDSLFCRACDASGYREAERLLAKWLFQTDHEYPEDLSGWGRTNIARAGYYLDFLSRIHLLAREDCLPLIKQAASHLGYTLPAQNDLIAHWGIRGWQLDYNRLSGLRAHCANNERYSSISAKLTNS